MGDLLAGGVASRARFGQRKLRVWPYRQFPLYAVHAVFQPPQLAALRIDQQI